MLTCIFDTACDQHISKPEPHGKHVIKYKNMQKWMVEFLGKYKSRGDKIILVNSIRNSQCLGSL